MKVPLADDKRDEWKTRVERGGSDHGRRRGHCRTDVLQYLGVMPFLNFDPFCLCRPK